MKTAGSALTLLLAAQLPWALPRVMAQNSIADHVVISEIQIGGDDADDEFIELYNPTASTVSLSGWKLRRKSSTGSESSLVSDFGSSATIAAHGFYLIASPDVAYDGPTADITYTNSSNRIAANNTVLLYSNGGATLVDKVAWGSDPDLDPESSPAANPPANGSIERKASAYSTAATLGPGGIEEHAGNGQDSNNNSADFVLQSVSNPQNTSSAIETDAPIPVKLLAFYAETKGLRVILKWATASETENLGFLLFRANQRDGKFEQITSQMIPGAGNSNEAVQYEFSDDLERAGLYFYKLANIDYNGTMSFHGPIAVRVAGTPPRAFELLQNHPNPFNPATTIGFKLPEDSIIDLSIIDATGKLIRQLISGRRQAGKHLVVWDGLDAQGKQVPSGVYFYQLKTGNFSTAKKLTLLK